MKNFGITEVGVEVILAGNVAILDVVRSWF
jgi:hypothetical protein